MSSTSQKKNIIVGFTCGAFDVFHAGHMLMLKEARTNCDYLIVGLQSDPTIDRPQKNKPVQSIEERKIQLEGCSYVDEIMLYNTEADLENIFKNVSINVRIIGADYIDKSFTAKDYCLQNNIKIIYNTRGHGYSSTELRDRVYKAEKAKREK